MLQSFHLCLLLCTLKLNSLNLKISFKTFDRKKYEVVLTIARPPTVFEVTRQFFYFFYFFPSSAFLRDFSVCQDRLSGDVSELGMALLCSSRGAGSVYVAVSRNSIVHRDWGRTIECVCFIVVGFC